MVTAFLQLHHDVDKRSVLSTGFHIQSCMTRMKSLNERISTRRDVTLGSRKRIKVETKPLTLVVSSENVLVVLLLHGGEFDSNDELCLGGHSEQDVGLESTQHVGSQHVVKLFDLLLLGDVAEDVLELEQILRKGRRGKRYFAFA